MPQDITPEQEDKIIALYKSGETFKQASAQLPAAAELEYKRGFYDALAAVGQLNDEQVGAVYGFACNPPEKPTCGGAVKQIAQAIAQEENRACTERDVNEVLRKRFRVQQ